MGGRRFDRLLRQRARSGRRRQTASRAWRAWRTCLSARGRGATGGRGSSGRCPCVRLARRSTSSMHAGERDQRNANGRHDPHRHGRCGHSGPGIGPDPAPRGELAESPEACKSRRSGPPSHPSPGRRGGNGGCAPECRFSRFSREGSQRQQARQHLRAQRAVPERRASFAVVDVLDGYLPRLHGQPSVPVGQQAAKLRTGPPPGARDEQPVEDLCQVVTRPGSQGLRLVPGHAQHGGQFGFVQAMPDA